MNSATNLSNQPNIKMSKTFTYHIRPDSQNKDRFMVAFSMNTNFLEGNETRRSNPMILLSNTTAQDAIEFARTDRIDPKNTQILVEF